MTLPSLTELRIRQLEAERDELARALVQAREIAAALEEQNAAALALHEKGLNHPVVGWSATKGELCKHDWRPWPCETVRALTGDVP